MYRKLVLHEWRSNQAFPIPRVVRYVCLLSTSCCIHSVYSMHYAGVVTMVTASTNLFGPDTGLQSLPTFIFLFTQPPMRRMRICFTDVFFCFLFSVFFVFFRPLQKYQTTVLGNG